MSIIILSITGRSREGAWIEIRLSELMWLQHNLVAPVRERGLKFYKSKSKQCLRHVAPVRERGLKYQFPVDILSLIFGRSREGAWIEMAIVTRAFPGGIVAPVRERGLKYFGYVKHTHQERRSREGAWIEIVAKAKHQ